MILKLFVPHTEKICYYIHYQLEFVLIIQVNDFTGLKESGDYFVYFFWFRQQNIE